MSVHIAVAGLGFGRRHVTALGSMSDVTIVALADLNEARVREIADQYGARAYTDWKDLMDAEDRLDAVVLATPARVRLEPIRAVCDRAIALFCEKPPALDLATAQRAARAIDEAGVINSVGFHYRWAPAANRMRELVAGKDRLFARIVVAWPVFDWVRRGNAPPTFTKKTCAAGR